MTASAGTRPQQSDGVVIAPVPKEDLRACEQITREAFQFADVDVIPAWLMFTSSLHGGLTLGAYVDGELAGYSLALAAHRDGRPYLYSIGLLVRPGHEGRGLGTSLKLAQREHARQLGYELIRWSVEPLASRPIYLYLTGLGARLTGYQAELYEEFSLGGIDGGIVADEAEVEWRLAEPLTHAESRCASDGLSERLLTETVPHDDGVRELRGVREPADAGPLFVELPWDLQRLKEVSIKHATDWRLGVRETMTALFERGFAGTAVLLDVDESRSFVRFER